MAKAEISGNSDLTPDLLELRFIIDWLMSVGVSSPRLAALFGTSPENIRRLKYFAVRQLEPSLITFVPDLEMVPSTAMHGGVGIRSHREILRRSEKPSPTLPWLEEQIQARFESHRQQYQFLEGARRLIQLKQKLGHMSEARRLALAGILEQKISWFLVHSGFTRSAISHASLSLWLLQTAYYRLSRKDDVREFIKSTLIAAHANLLAARPAAVLLIHAGQETRNIHKRHQRNIEGVAEPHEPRALVRCVDIQRPRQHLRLIGHDAHRGPANPPETHHNVARKLGVDFQKIGAVHDQRNNVAHVVPGLGFERHHIVEARLVHPALVGFGARRVLLVVRRQEGKQPFTDLGRFHVVLRHEMRSEEHTSELQ